MGSGRWLSKGPLAAKRKEMAPGKWLEGPPDETKGDGPRDAVTAAPGRRLANAQLLAVFGGSRHVDWQVRNFWLLSEAPGPVV